MTPPDALATRIEHGLPAAPPADTGVPGHALSTSPRPRRAILAKYLAIFRVSLAERMTYRGDFLFGGFTIADAMYAPVVTRFRTYKFDLEREADAYCDAIMALPAMQEWVAAAKNEPMIIDQYEF